MHSKTPSWPMVKFLVENQEISSSNPSILYPSPHHVIEHHMYLWSLILNKNNNNKKNIMQFRLNFLTKFNRNDLIYHRDYFRTNNLFLFFIFFWKKDKNIFFREWLYNPFGHSSDSTMLKGEENMASGYFSNLS